MKEFMPAMPETTKNGFEIDKREIHSNRLMRVFKENQDRISQLLHDEETHTENESLIIEQDIRDLSMNEDAKKILQQERQIANRCLDLRRKNEMILKQMSESNSNEASEFVWNEIKRDENFFFDYWEECLEILKKGNVSRISKNIMDYVSSGKIQKCEYFLYAHILTELFPEVREEFGAKKIEELLKSFEESHGDMVMLSILLKSAKATGEEVDFETIRNLKLEKRMIGEKDENGAEISLSEEEKAEMMKMVEKNYREVVFPDNPEAAEAVISDFKNELYGPDNFHGQIIYDLKFQNQLAGMVRFGFNPPKESGIILKEGEIYAASFNVHQEVNKSCLGKYLTGIALPEVLEKYQRIKAITRADNPLAVRKGPGEPSPYENQGFAIDREYPFEKHGVTYYNMVMERANTRE